MARWFVSPIITWWVPSEFIAGCIVLAIGRGPRPLRYQRRHRHQDKFGAQISGRFDAPLVELTDIARSAPPCCGELRLELSFRPSTPTLDFQWTRRWWLPMFRMGSSYEPHGLFPGRLAGLEPVHDELPPAPQVSQEAELSKHISQDVAQPIRDRVRFGDDPSAQLPLCTPSSPSARPALALKGCGDGPATMTSFELRRMILLIRGCGVAPRDPDGFAYVVVLLLRLAREWRVAGDASGADSLTSDIEDILIHHDLLADSDRTELLQRLRAFQSSASLPLCSTCEAECSKGETYHDLGRLLLRDCPCRPSLVSPASEAAPAA